MNIFGFLFDNDPELDKWRKQKKEDRRQNIIRACERKLKENEIAWNYQDCDLACDMYHEDYSYMLHKELKKKTECHEFNGKKYCYHTGKEIIKEK